jgi:hypothetical protein
MASTSYFQQTNGDFDVQGNETYVAPNNRGLTFGTWVNFAAIELTQHILGKWNSAGGSIAYRLYLSGGILRASISEDGVALSDSVNSSVIPVVNQWYFVVLSFSPGAVLAITVNDTQDSIVPRAATIAQETGTQLTAGAEQGGTNPGSLFLSGAWLAGQYHDESIINIAYALGEPLYREPPDYVPGG